MLESLRFLNEQSERARQGGKQQKADKRQTSSG
jgi:hypothetical protein